MREVVRLKVRGHHLHAARATDARMTWKLHTGQLG